MIRLPINWPPKNNLTFYSTLRTMHSMKRTIKATKLEYMLLGLLGQRACSGYDLRKVITQTPLRHFSDSPGAIYPALTRLLKRKWISSSAPHGARRRQEFRINDSGRKALTKWLAKTVTREDVVDRSGELILRFAFMGQELPASAIIRFLKEYRSEMSAYLSELQAFYKENTSSMPLMGRLAFRHGLVQYKACIQWAGEAIQMIEKESNQQ